MPHVQGRKPSKIQKLFKKIQKLYQDLENKVDEIRFFSDDNYSAEVWAVSSRIDTASEKISKQQISNFGELVTVIELLKIRASEKDMVIEERLLSKVADFLR